MRARWPFLLALFFALAATPAAACEETLPPQMVRCDDAAGVLGSHYSPWRWERSADSLLTELCPAASPELQNLFERYNVEAISAAFTIEPYTPEREAELVAGLERYLDCEYMVFERVGDWLASREQRRSYCPKTFSFSGYSCPSSIRTFSPSRFFLFLVANPGASTLPYLLPYLLLVVALVALLLRLVRRGQLQSFFRPTVGVVGAYVGPLVFCCFWTVSIGFTPLELVVGWLLFGYLLCCLGRGALRDQI